MTTLNAENGYYTELQLNFKYNHMNGYIVFPNENTIQVYTNNIEQTRLMITTTHPYVAYAKNCDVNAVRFSSARSFAFSPRITSLPRMTAPNQRNTIQKSHIRMVIQMPDNASGNIYMYGSWMPYIA